MSGLLQDVPDAAAVVLWYVQVLDLAALNVLLLAAYDVYTGTHDQQQVLTFEEVDRHRVVGRQIGLDVHGQKLERILLAFVLRAELGGRYLLNIANVHSLISGVQLMKATAGCQLSETKLGDRREQLVLSRPKISLGGPKKLCHNQLSEFSEARSSILSVKIERT